MRKLKWFSIAAALFTLTLTAMFYSAFAQAPAPVAPAAIQPAQLAHGAAHL
jgi:hypothetical protein